ncbi:MAG TPA: hypothetical protein VF974_02755 [Patescibacteria group bacterium]
MKSKIGIGLGIIILLLIAGFYWFGNNLAGGGGSSQYAPDTVKTGQPAEIKLDLSVTSGTISGRYNRVSLYYKLVGDADNKSITNNPVPKIFSGDQSKFNGKYETYTFTIPPYPKGTKGEIEYYITLALDGHTSKIDGIKRIKIID